MDYLIHYVMFEMWTAIFYVNYLSYFQQWNLNKDITFLSSSIDSKLKFFECWLYFQVFSNSQRDFGIFKCCSFWTSQIFQFMKKMENCLFFFKCKPMLHFQIFPNSLKSWKIGIFEVPLI